MAEVEFLGLKASGEGEAGGRIFVDRPPKADRAKFEEYRDLSPGVFLERLRLRFESQDEKYSLVLGATDAGREDQSFFLYGSRLGWFTFGFEWDQIPHDFSNTARSPYSQGPRDVFDLPDSLQRTLQGASAAAQPGILGSFLATAPGVDLQTRWDTARLLLNFTPIPDWDLHAEYARTLKTGDRAMGMIFGSPGGNLVELPGSIDQTVHDFRVTAGLAREWWQLQLGYNLSIFQNDLDALIADNPLRVTDAPLGPTGTSAPAHGRSSLAPNNTAQTVSLTGGLNLPWRSRLAGTFAYGWRSQDQAFLPHTINSAIVDPRLTLPASNLDGDVRTILANLQFTSRPFRTITLGARYRFYDFDDQTPTLLFPAHVVNDTTLNTDPVASSRFSYTKQNAGADVAWRPLTPISTKVGFEWEQWNRDNDHREAPLTNDYTPKIALDYTPVDWLLLRASYAYTWRRISGYNTFAHLSHTVLEEETLQEEIPQSQSTLLRKYDEANRDRNRADLLLQFAPFDTLTFTPSLSFRDDNYTDSPLGLQDDTSWAVGFDVAWSPTDRISLFASYMREEYDARMRSQFRQPPDQLDNPTFEWVANNRDSVNTAGAGVDAALIPKKLDFRLAWTFSTARGKMTAFNPVTPSGGTAAVNTSATAMNFPTITDRLNQLEASLKYHLTPASYVRFRYIFEKYDITDFRTGDIQPFMGGTDIWLGAQIRGYTAQFFTITLGYRF
jgi:MtrB/PioB family decaheme-associated outer membrane protein